MKKSLSILLISITVVTGLIVLININVTTRQGVNYQWRTIKIPLYLKILDFFDRHYNYKELVKRIVADTKDDSEEVLKIFEWTYWNIRKAPEDFPVIDDHVWYIIVRGYGVKDQFSDVFTTLCNYAHIDAFFTWVHTRDRTGRIPLSFVKIGKSWHVFDPYHGIFFKNKNGEIATIEEIKSGSSWFVKGLGEKPDIDYTAYLDNLTSVEDIGLTRANIQSPLRRLIFEIKKWITKLR